MDGIVSEEVLQVAESSCHTQEAVSRVDVAEVPNEMPVIGGRKKQPNGERSCLSKRFEPGAGGMDGPKGLARD
jgi:hypothetical protein